MRARLVLPLVAIAFVAACGGSSTGLKPPAATQTISVSNGGFSPETLSVIVNTQVIWQATEGTHVITFTGSVPSGSNPNSSTFGTGQNVQARFVMIGSYTYKDSLSASHTGLITVHN